MAVSAEQLNIILSARDKEFTKAMDRSQRRVEMFAKKSQKGLSKTGKSFDALGAAASRFGVALSTGAIITGAARMIDNATMMAKELDNLSRMAGVGVERFQELAFASRTVGIEQEKLADILKDVNDKFGDYAVTGAGPLVDFFDNIAPKVGITQKAFEGLSSDKALGLYIKTLQEAGVNQQEMTFYMEALASDATALTPLFYNNAAAMDEMALSARDLGVVMDQSIIQGAVEMRDRWDQVLSAMSTKFNRFALGVANGLDMLFNVSEQEQLFEIGQQLADTMEDRRKLTDRMIQIVGKGEKAPAGAQAQVQGRLTQTEADMNALLSQQAALTAAIEQRAGLEEKLNNLMTDTAASGAGVVVSAQDRVAAEQELVRLRGMSAEAIERERIELEKQSIILQAMNGNKNGSATFDPASTQAWLDAHALGEEYERAAIAASKILNPIEGVAAASSVAASSLEEVVDFMAEASPLLSRLGVDAEAFQGIMSSVEGSMESAFMSMVDGTSTASDAFKSMATDIIKELYRVLVVKQITGFISGAIGGYFNANQMSGPSMPLGTGNIRPPNRAGGGSAIAGQAYTVGEHGREPFIPAQNGRILSTAQAKSAIGGGGGGGVTVIQNNTFGNGVNRSEINAMLPKIVEASKAAVLDAKRRGGSFAGAF